MGGNEALGGPMNTNKLTAADCAVVVVDMQERLLPAIHESARVVVATRLVLHAARVLEIPAILTTQYLKGLGATVPDVAELAPGAPIDKLTFSCFGSAEFAAALERTGRRTLLVCGVEAHICVLQTGLDALAAGYRVHVVTDATSSRSPVNAALGHRRLEAAGAVLSSSEMAIYELLAVSGTSAFKAMLPHFK
jgi:nicotinamidase-related amidase